jgi:hypothetical protein
VHQFILSVSNGKWPIDPHVKLVLVNIVIGVV